MGDKTKCLKRNVGPLPFLYIRMYNQALRDYKHLLEDYTKLNQAYLDVENKLIELQDLMKGGEDECFKKKK